MARILRPRIPPIRRFFKTAHRFDCKTRALARIGLGLWLGAWPLAAKAEVVDLELLLAVDTSISVSREEYQLQIQGLAQAFQDPRVLAAIGETGDRGIAVSVVQWASHAEQYLAVEWTKVRNAEDALRISEGISSMPRRFAGYGTAITSALRFCARAFFGNGFEAWRRVIDVSGDGSDNRGPLPDATRDTAVRIGITINGLAIRNEEPNLEFYYRQHVIGGPGAFVMTADDYHDFADAVVVKLIREISQVPIATAPKGPPLPGRLAAWAGAHGQTKTIRGRFWRHYGDAGAGARVVLEHRHFP